VLSILLVLVVEERWIIVLLHKFLRRLVHLHVLHGGSGLARLLFSSSFLFLSSSSVYLHLLELIEDVLVMQERVGELILEFLTLEESLNTALENGHLEELMDCRSLSWVTFKHHSDQIGNCGREVGRQRCVLALDDFLRQLMQRTGIEGRGQSSHLV